MRKSVLNPQLKPWSRCFPKPHPTGPRPPQPRRLADYLGPPLPNGPRPLLKIADNVEPKASDLAALEALNFALEHERPAIANAFRSTPRRTALTVLPLWTVKVYDP